MMKKRPHPKGKTLIEILARDADRQREELARLREENRRLREEVADLNEEVADLLRQQDEQE